MAEDPKKLWRRVSSVPPVPPGLSYDLFKSYDTKQNYFHFFVFCYFVQKWTFVSFAFFASCVISVVPIKISTC